ncbi:uncharacterized protein TNCV_590681 [Trichonephila clavipes]|nr:uncharacterized protein TNCV_590681 [Trichonephila clavipes]
MVSDGTEFAVGDIERLFEEARRNTKIKHEKWEKYYNRRRRNVQIKVNDWVLIATHPLSSATRKVVAKFKPKFEGPYRVLDLHKGFLWKAGKRLTINVDQVRIYRHRKCDETEIGTGSSRITVVYAMNRVVLAECNGDQMSRKMVKRKGRRSIPSSWSEKSRIKRSKNEIIGYKRSRESGSSGPDRKLRKSSDYRVPKRVLSSNDSVFQKCSRKRPKQDKVAVSTNRYNLRLRGGREVESRSAMERKTQQGGPVRSWKGRGRKDSPYIEERTRSNNRNARRGGDRQRQNQERKGACTGKSIPGGPGRKRQLQS